VIQAIEIPAVHGIILIDAEDHERISAIKWISHKNLRNTYARGVITRKPKQKMVYLHRFLMNPPDGYMVDHINGNGLDNRRCNLRIVTRSQNFWNARVSIGTKSGFKGVEPDGDKFRARLQCNKKRFDFGLHDTAIEAALAYNRGALEHFGEFARLNEVNV
jgi:hypothetical protein